MSAWKALKIEKGGGDPSIFHTKVIMEVKALA
jgi:hypothetical protein